jgi:hypothetical protein
MNQQLNLYTYYEYTTIVLDSLDFELVVNFYERLLFLKFMVSSEYL